MTITADSPCMGCPCEGCTGNNNACHVYVAYHRVQLKRQLRKAGIAFSNTDPTSHLETLMKGVA